MGAKKKGGGKSPKKKGDASPKRAGSASPRRQTVGGPSRQASARLPEQRDPRAQAYAAEQWARVQLEAAEHADQLECRAAYAVGSSVEEFRERRALGLARAQAITRERAAEEGGLSIPLLLLSARQEQQRMMHGELREADKAARAERDADEQEDRSAREIIEAMHDEGRAPSATYTSLPTAAWPQSNRVSVSPLPGNRRGAMEPETPRQYTLTAATV